MPKVYIVIRDSEGCGTEIKNAYRSREAADTRCARLNQLEQDKARARSEASIITHHDAILNVFQSLEACRSHLEDCITHGYYTNHSVKEVELDDA